MMIGAGLVALGQALAAARRRDGDADGRTDGEEVERTRSPRKARAGIAGGFVLYLAAAGALAGLGGLWAGLGGASLVLWIVFAAIACVAAEFIVGLSAMEAGWFPAFATALVFLLLGMAAGFPPVASALLVGFVASGGRRQQLVTATAGLLTALVMVALFHDVFFGAGRLPPIVEVYVTAIEAGLGGSEAAALFGWALPGAAVQRIGGPRRQLGILFATGLLISNPLAGWAVLLGLGIRRVCTRGDGDLEEEPATVFAGGLIAGDALWGFGAALF